MTGVKSVLVVGSVNLDLVAMAPRLPVAGETVTGATLHRFPGGKGANQALAARRLGAEVQLIGCVGDDDFAAEALALLRDGDVDLSDCKIVAGEATGIGMIAVAPSGENQIVVAPGANHRMDADTLRIPAADAVICQLEVPMGVLQRVAAEFGNFFSINLAPAMEVSDDVIERADLIVVNDTEAAFYGKELTAHRSLVAVTHGSEGAELFEAGRMIAEARPPAVTAIDSTGAGDTFVAALTVGLIEGQAPDDALRFACAAGAASVTRPGAQPSLPTRAEVEALLAGSSRPHDLRR
jgi:ribokinase